MESVNTCARLFFFFFVFCFGDIVECLNVRMNLFS